MLLIFHITIAVLNLILATFAYFHPSENKIKLTYLFTAFTFTSGSILVIEKPSHLVQSCITGIIYLGVVIFAIAKARQKLTIPQK